MPSSPVYSKRLATVNLAAGAEVEIAAPPAGHTYVIRDVQTRQDGTATNEVIFRDLTAGAAIILTVPAPSGKARSWSGYLVLPATHRWSIRALGAVADVTVSGYDLLDATVTPAG